MPPRDTCLHLDRGDRYIFLSLSPEDIEFAACMTELLFVRKKKQNTKNLVSCAHGPSTACHFNRLAAQLYAHFGVNTAQHTLILYCANTHKQLSILIVQATKDNIIVYQPSLTNV